MRQSTIKDPTNKDELRNKTDEWIQRTNICIDNAKANPSLAIETLRSLRDEMRNELEFARQTDNSFLESISKEISQSVNERITKNNVSNFASDLKIGLSYHLKTGF